MNQASINKSDKADGDYTTVKLPKALVEGMIDPFIEDKMLGYTSRADVIKSAIRTMYLNLTSQQKNEEPKPGVSA